MNRPTLQAVEAPSPARAATRPSAAESQVEIRACGSNSQASGNLGYNSKRHKNRSTRHYLQRRHLKRRLTKLAFLAVVAAVSLLTGYLLVN